MPEIKNYRVTQTRRVEVSVGSDIPERAALEIAEAAFLNPTPGRPGVVRAVEVVDTRIERI